MSRTIHGSSHKALKAFRKKSAALPVYWIYVSRMNNEGVAWPSSAGLAKDTGWNKAACLEGRKHLVSIGALELVEGYIRPEWRELTPQARTRKMNVDKTEYYRPTGYVVINDKKIPMLYNGGDEPSTIDEQPSDGKNRLTSDALGHRTALDVGHSPMSETADGQNASTELNSSIQLGSSNTELDSTKEKKTAPNGAKSSSKPSKGFDFTKPPKEWQWPQLEQYACEHPTIEILVALDGVPKLKNLATAPLARDAVELFKELQRNNITPERWQSLYTAREKISGTYNAFKKMLYALPNWLKSEPQIKVVPPPADPTPGVEPAFVIVGKNLVPVEEYRKSKGRAS